MSKEIYHQNHEENILKAKNNIIKEQNLLTMAEFYKALADSTRIKIIGVLFDNELCVNAIAQLLGMTKSAISHQLRYLREKNIVSNKKDGKEVLYSLADEHIKQIFAISLSHMEEYLYEN